MLPINATQIPWDLLLPPSLKEEVFSTPIQEVPYYPISGRNPTRLQVLIKERAQP